MTEVNDLTAWLAESDRELQEWLEGLEAESERTLQWLVEQSSADPLEQWR